MTQQQPASLTPRGVTLLICVCIHGFMHTSFCFGSEGYLLVPIVTSWQSRNSMRSYDQGLCKKVLGWCKLLMRSKQFSAEMY